MFVYCHRAGNDLAQLAALKTAGFRIVEGDVMFARDTPVMVHPAGLPNRLPDGNLDYSADEVREILAGKGIQMPTLVEVGDAIRDLGMRLLLETKIPRTVELLRPSMPLMDRVIISFLGEELVEAYGYQSGRQRFRTGVLMAHAPTGAVARVMVETYAVDMALMDHWYLTESSVQAFRPSGSGHTHVVAYTVNDLERARVMRDLGVDAILSDNPRQLVDAAGGWLQPG